MRTAPPIYGWAPCLIGLNRFDRESERFTRYQHDPNDPHSLSNNTITAIYQDQPGNLWVGTGGGGLNRLNRRTETFDHYTEKDGLPSNTIFAMLPDDDGSFWISTAGGLSRFDPQSDSFRNYTASDGLPGDLFNEFAAYKSHDGELFFGGRCRGAFHMNFLNYAKSASRIW